MLFLPLPERTFAMEPLNKSTELLKALIVEDELAISNLLKIHLVQNQFSVRQAETAEAGWQELQNNNYDLCLLDWMLPGSLQGIDLLKKIRQEKPNLKIMMVTAKADPESIVQGIEAGADDYLVKPFDARVLLARIRNMIRHGTNVDTSVQRESSHTVEHDGLKINFSKYIVIYKNEPVHLTPSEFKLLSALFKARGQVLSRDQLIDQIQGEDVSVTGRTIDTHIFSLRKKVGEWSDHVETIRGVGYRILTDINHRTEQTEDSK